MPRQKALPPIYDAAAQNLITGATKIKRLPGRGPLFRYLFKSQDMLLPPPFAPAKKICSICQIFPSAFIVSYSFRPFSKVR